MQQGVKDVDGAAVHPSLLQHLSKYVRQHLLDGPLGGQQVPVGHGVHACGGELNLRGSLLQYVRTHVLQDGAHDHHPGGEGGRASRFNSWGGSRGRNIQAPLLPGLGLQNQEPGNQPHSVQREGGDKRKLQIPSRRDPTSSVPAQSLWRVGRALAS